MKHILYTSVALLMTLVSCESFLDIENPKNELIIDDVFNSDPTATSAMMGVYVQMSTETGGASSITYLGGLLADDLTLYSTDIPSTEIYNNNITVANSFMTSFWGSSSYSRIYNVNAILEGLDQSDLVTPAVKVQLQGEALFLRAFFHFYLLNEFGDVPYITSTDYRVNTKVSRLPAQEVYEHIAADLLAAQSMLPDNYTFAGSERIRPNKWAATAMLARVYLYNSKWEMAETQASLLIDNKSLYSLVPHDEAFLKNSKEAIWQIKPISTTRNTNEGNIFILTTTPRFSALTSGIVNGFETGDIRKQKWVKSIVVGTATYYYPFKYKIQTGATPLNEYSMVLRLAEQYLIRAEARAQLNRIPDAIKDLDVIRQRSSLPLLATTNPTISRDNLLLAIERERRFELFTEWGHRWFDLKRTGRASTVLAPVKSGWQSTDVLFPLPQIEILVNRNLEQNPGY